MTTYGDVAEMVGAPRAWRAVGTVMRECGDPAVPCHRVVGAGGTIGGYGSSGLHTKRERLRAEGLTVTATRIVGFTNVRWSPRATRSRR